MGKDDPMRGMFRVTAVLASMLLLAGCATSNKDATAQLWNQWRAIDQLMEPEYPDAPPIILIHGWNGSEFTWPAPEELEKVKARLHRDIYFFTYNTGIALSRYPPLEVVEEQFERFLSNFKQVDVVAHSMGGLIVREYLLHHAHEPIRRVIFLSTPHFGTNAAKLLVDLASVSSYGNLQANEMLPGSDFLWQLNQAEGEELAGVQVLNVFVADKSFASSDLIVGTHSAYLPGEPNVAIVGDHHTPALNLAHLGFIEKFLQTGEVPPPAPVPQRRDVWIRVMHDGKAMRLPASALRRTDAKGMVVKSGMDLCCQELTGMDDMGQSTIVAEDVQPGDHLQVFLRRTGQRLDIDLAAAELPGHPVTLRLVETPPLATNAPPKVTSPARGPLPKEHAPQLPAPPEPAPASPAAAKPAAP
jgi:pimeloyl-ACP methyl ester carboxylesterase